MALACFSAFDYSSCDQDPLIALFFSDPELHTVQSWQDWSLMGDGLMALHYLLLVISRHGPYGLLISAYTKGLFGTAHNSFVSCCELFFFCQTLIFKTTSLMKLFFSSSHKDISWNEAEKSSLLQLSPSFLSLNYAWSSWWSYFAKHFFQNSSVSSRKSLMKLFSKKTVLLKLSCAKQALNSSFLLSEIIPKFQY